MPTIVELCRARAGVVWYASAIRPIPSFIDSAKGNLAVIHSPMARLPGTCASSQIYIRLVLGSLVNATTSSDAASEITITPIVLGSRTSL